MDTTLRNTGIVPLGPMPWGTHVCLFYENKKDLLDTVIPYFKAGLESKERCMWAISEPVTVDEAQNALSQAVPAFDRYLAAGSIDLFLGRGWYLNGGRFDMKRLIALWNEKLRDALSKGYGGMRASGNAFWLETKHWKDFCDYEYELNQSLTGQSMTVLCTYPLTVSRSLDVLDVVRAHQFTMARRKGDWEFIEARELEQSKQQLNLDLTRNSAASSSLREAVSRRIASLTSRERQVLQLVVEGNTNKQIASVLRISQRTVETHRAAVMKKIGALSLPELIHLTIAASGRT